jgi:hypothetical protein
VVAKFVPHPVTHLISRRPAHGPVGPIYEGERRDRESGTCPDGHSHAVNMASLLIRQKAGFKSDSIAHE